MSASFLVNGSIPTGAILLTAGATVTLSLADTSGAATVEWEFLGASEPTTYPAITITGRGTASFTAPTAPGHGAGLSLVLQCRNAGQATTALLCVGTTTQIAAAENQERGPGYWAHQVNANAGSTTLNGTRVTGITLSPSLTSTVADGVATIQEARSVESFGAKGDCVTADSSGTDDTAAFQAAFDWCRGANKAITYSRNRFYKLRAGVLKTWRTFQLIGPGKDQGALWFVEIDNTKNLIELGGLEPNLARPTLSPTFGTGSTWECAIKGVTVAAPSGQKCKRVFNAAYSLIRVAIDAKVHVDCLAVLACTRDAPTMAEWVDGYDERQGGITQHLNATIDTLQNNAQYYGVAVGNPDCSTRLVGYGTVVRLDGDVSYPLAQAYYFERPSGAGTYDFDVDVYGSVQGVKGIVCVNTGGIRNHAYIETSSSRIETTSTGKNRPGFQNFGTNVGTEAQKYRTADSVVSVGDSSLDWDETTQGVLIVGDACDYSVRTRSNEIVLGKWRAAGVGGTFNPGAFSGSDPRNILQNGNFETFTAVDGVESNALNWLPFSVGNSYLGTKCGIGCADTTKTVGADNCIKMVPSSTKTVAQARAIISGPLEPHLLGGYVSASFKYKITSGGPLALGIIAGNDVTWSYTHSLLSNMTLAADNGFTLCTIGVPITQEMVDNGIALAVVVSGTPTVYISEAQAAIGYRCARTYVPPDPARFGAVDSSLPNDLARMLLFYELSALNAGHIVGLYFAEDSLLDASSLVSANNGRIGAASSLSGTGRFALTLSGKRLAYSRGANTPQIIWPTVTAAKTIYCTATPPATLPPGYNLALLSNGNASDFNDGAPFLVGSASTDWYTAGGWSHFKNGVADESVGAGGGPFVYTAKKAVNAMTGMIYGVWSGGTPCFPTGGTVVLALDNSPSADIDARNVAAIRRYCGF